MATAGTGLESASFASKHCWLQRMSVHQTQCRCRSHRIIADATRKPLLQCSVPMAVIMQRDQLWQTLKNCSSSANCSVV